MVFKLVGLNKLFFKSGATTLPSQKELKEMDINKQHHFLTILTIKQENLNS